MEREALIKAERQARAAAARAKKTSPGANQYTRLLIGVEDEEESDALEDERPGAVVSPQRLEDAAWWVINHDERTKTKSRLKRMLQAYLKRVGFWKFCREFLKAVVFPPKRRRRRYA
jgi:hypothetical protein